MSLNAACHAIIQKMTVLPQPSFPHQPTPTSTPRFPEPIICLILQNCVVHANLCSSWLLCSASTESGTYFPPDISLPLGTFRAFPNSPANAISASRGHSPLILLSVCQLICQKSGAALILSLPICHSHASWSVL